MPQAVDDYIAGFPDDVRKKLVAMRKTIRRAAPDATERVSYGIPTFDLDGRPLVYFAGFRNHLSVYPAPRGYPEFKEELSGYKGGKGTVQFPHDEPIPHDLIRRIVEFRKKGIATAAAAKKRPAPKPKKRT